MASQRILRVQNLLRSEISTIFQRRLKDPRVNMVTITEVDADPDLKHARVFISVYGGADAEAETLAGLRSASGFIRRELMKVLHLRPMPLLEFEVDDTLERAAHTLDLLDQITHEQEDIEPGSGAGEGADSEQ
jgi:ribosome-binding factor A